MESAAPILGIDLGTTNSLCAIFGADGPELIPNAHGELLTPSVVGVLDSGEVVVGRTACELALTKPEHTVACFKRWMGEDRRVKLGGVDYSAPELSSLVLRSLAEDAAAQLGRPAGRAVITVPAYFNEHQRRATQRAGELAGLEVLRVVNEPTAAALAYGFHRADESRTLIVFDLGGGTFDVTVMEVFEGSLEILATAGESRLGGEDFTDKLLGWALNQRGMQLEVAELQQPALVARLRRETEAAKFALSRGGVATLRIPDEAGELESDSPTLEVNETDFEQLVSGLLDRLSTPAKRALRDARKDWSEIDEVLLVGGATRMPLVRGVVKQLTGLEPRADHDPDQIVALGAAVQAALIADDAAVEDLVMTDVCPFTLGVEVVKEFGARQADGYFQPVIHRNTTIPVSKEEYFSTVEQNQHTVMLRVYQGESRRTHENLKLGEMKISGIPPGPAGQQIIVRFTYDLNGLLEVEAQVQGTDQRFKTVLRQAAAGLTDKEVAAALERMQSVKFYPRDKLDNQRLLQFAEGVLREQDRFLRAELEASIEVYEAALHLGTREVFDAARSHLLIKLSGLGFPYEPAEDATGD